MATQEKTVWAIDPSHSEIQFKVKHLVVTTLTGKFERFNATLETINNSFENATITFEADVDSINTNNADRDNHLKSDDFFNAALYPKIKFVSSSFTKSDENTYKLVGDITIRDITKTIELKVEYGGSIVDPWGNTKAGFEINGKISRKDFNLKWNVLTETGGAVVSDEVKLNLNVEMHKQN